ncbi:MAG: L,D-transpeptidase family protein [Mailhella sp.]|nr:L,D-transpeptidase family protein [Mailhella sp.]
MKSPIRHVLHPALAVLFSAAILAPSAALADGWTARLLPDSLPELTFAADKAGRELIRIDRKGASPRIIRHDCIHGRVEGDKQKQGDLKTPEGVYFVTRKVAGPLDFMEYGPHAFALDYPNPVDRLRGKTGGGIWLHSKGRPIKGITTRGCLAVEQDVITGLVGTAVPGVPVVIAEHVDAALLRPAPEPKEGEAERASAPDASAEKKSRAAVLKALESWAAALKKDASDAMAYYDAKRFAAAGGDSMKEVRGRLSAKRLPRHGMSEACFFPGPGYTVTSWREAGNGALHVLYWMTDKTGAPKIVGEKSIR